MRKDRKPTAGRLYYTFGTILLMAVITVCTMNFIQDSRIMNKPVVAAAKVNEAGVAANTGSKTNEGKDGGTKESETKFTGTKPTGTKPAKTKPADVKPAETKPINPGEEP